MRPNHPKYMMSLSIGLLALSGCSEQSSQDNTAARNQPTSESISAADAASSDLPDVSAAAPGVAFAYNYAFTLPAKAISDVQQQHATACGRLGADRCQITGMRFDQPREGEAAARLDLLLAPELAHQFGREGIATVEKADGTLESADIAGENAGGAINASHQRSSVVKAELMRIEARLKTAGLVKETRIELERRILELRGQLQEEGQGRQAAERSFATTPLSFAYASEGLLSPNRNPFSTAAKASWGSAQALLSFVLLIGGALLPWALLIGLLLALWRSRLIRDWRKRSDSPVI